MSAKRLLGPVVCAAIYAATTVGCGPSKPTNPPVPTPQPSAEETVEPATEPEPQKLPAVDKPRCAVQGELWDGNPTTCMYEHDGCCYPDPSALCKAAECDETDCAIVESRPAQVRCAAS